MHPRADQRNYVNVVKVSQIMSRWPGLRDQDNSIVAGIGGQVIRMRRRSVSFAWTERRILQGATARTLVMRSGWLLACPH